MTRTRRPFVAVRAAAVLATAGLALSGCTGGGSPGVAATVGEESLSVLEVDRAAENMCASITAGVGDPAAAQTVIPLSFVRQGTLQLLTLDAQARQIAEEYDVEPGPDYARELASSKQRASSLPPDAREDYAKVMSANALAVSLLERVGRVELERSGMTDPTTEEAGAAGVEVFRSWPEEHGIDVDPRYGLEVVDGQLAATDTHTSVAVSEVARNGLVGDVGQLDPAYLESLPSSQRCG